LHGFKSLNYLLVLQSKNGMNMNLSAGFNQNLYECLIVPTNILLSSGVPASHISLFLQKIIIDA